MNETKIYYDEDADLKNIDNRTIAIIGYGNQGRAQGLNMRDSGLEDIIVGNIQDKSWERAERDGFDVYPISEASERADILLILIPDEVAPRVFSTEIEKKLEKGNALVFSSGYSITFDLIHPPENTDVILVAPKMIGHMVRELYKQGEGAPALFAVDQNYSGNAKSIALSIAKGIGATRSGVIESTFDMETKSDLLTEQGLIPLFFNALIAKYELEIEEGFPPELILTEEYLSREMAYIFEQMAKKGVIEQMPLHSRTSQYGQLSRTDEIYEGKSDEIDFKSIKNFMKRQLNDIDNGKFAREWKNEQEKGRPLLKRLLKKYRESNFIQDEQRTMKNLRLKEEVNK